MRAGRRSRQAALLAAVLAAGVLAWAWSRSDDASPPAAASPPVHGGDGFAWMRLDLTDLADLPGLPVTVAIEGRAIRCRRPTDGPRILVLTFQRTGERAAYGTYALHGAKNDLLLDFPLEGDPIDWPHRNHGSALTHHLRLAGLESPQADLAVMADGCAWFDEGLRVFLTLPRRVAEAIPSLSERSREPNGPPVYLVIVDLPGD